MNHPSLIASTVPYIIKDTIIHAEVEYCCITTLLIINHNFISLVFFITLTVVVQSLLDHRLIHDKSHQNSLGSSRYAFNL